MRSPSASISSRSSEISSTAAPASRAREQLLRARSATAPTSRPQVGWCGDDQARRRAAVDRSSSARPRISFCMLPPDSARAGVDAGPPPRTSKRLEHVLARGARAARAPHPRAAREAPGCAGARTPRSPTPAGRRPRRRRAGPPGCARRRAATSAPASARSGSPAQPHAAASRRARAAQHVGQRQLAVARDAGDRRRSRRRAASARRRRAGRARAAGADVVERADGVADARRPAGVAASRTAWPTISAASCALRRSRAARASATSLPPRSTATRSRHAQHLGELVADEDDRQALGDHLAQRREQRLALLRRQHRGRLVEDQDARAAVQRLQDLDALALADRQVADARVRDRPRRPKRCADVEQPRARRARGARTAATAARCRASRCRARDRLSASVKCWCTMPMPAASAARGIARRQRLAERLDRALRRRT